MNTTGIPLAFAQWVSTRLREDAEAIARRWHDDLVARRPEGPGRVFPGPTLLNHIPELLGHIAESLTADTRVAGDRIIRDEGRRLARLRRRQGYESGELLAELDLLAEHMFEALGERVDDYDQPIGSQQAVLLARRLHRAVSALMAVTTEELENGGRTRRTETAEALREFAESLSHELNNRLLGARFSIELLQRRAVNGDEKVGEAVATVAETVDALSHLATDVYAVALSQSREDPVVGRWQSLRDIVADVLRDLRAYAGQRSVELRCELDGISDHYADGSRLRLALLNLVGNGIKYADHRKAECFVEVSCERSEGGWTFTIADNGIGIPREALAQIFFPTYRGPELEQPGSGLGLGIALRSIRQLGGNLEVDSQTGQGTRFDLFVPQAPSSLAELG